MTAQPTADIIGTTAGPRLHLALNNSTKTEMYFDCPVQLRRPAQGTLEVYDADSSRRNGRGFEYIVAAPTYIDALVDAITAVAPHQCATVRLPHSLWRGE